MRHRYTQLLMHPSSTKNADLLRKHGGKTPSLLLLGEEPKLAAEIG